MRNILFNILCLGFFACLPVQALAEETITMVADEWCPYNCAEDAEKPGYMIEIVQKALAPEVNVVYKVLPWTQAIEASRNGEYEGIIGASRGDAPDFIYPNVLQGISLSKFWVQQDSNWHYTTIDSLKTQRFGVVESYSYGKIIDPYVKEKTEQGTGRVSAISGANASPQNIERLLNRQIDVILEDENVIRHYFSSRGLPFPFKSAGNPVTIEFVDDTFVFVAFSPKTAKAKEYAERLTERVKQMRKSGELRKILARYHIDESYRLQSPVD
jgi:polar amino acid transport system substrate-binding protein